jgi:hypothetical protein
MLASCFVRESQVACSADTSRLGGNPLRTMITRFYGRIAAGRQLSMVFGWF